MDRKMKEDIINHLHVMPISTKLSGDSFDLLVYLLHDYVVIEKNNEFKAFEKINTSIDDNFDYEKGCKELLSLKIIEIKGDGFISLTEKGKKLVPKVLLSH